MVLILAGNGAERRKVRRMNKTCGTCFYHTHENIDDGWVCACGKSDNVAEWTEYDDSCEHWEPRP